nr:B290 [uncultured bacterium]
MRFHLRPLGVRQHKTFHPKRESHPRSKGNLEGSVRSRGGERGSWRGARPH